MTTAGNNDLGSIAPLIKAARFVSVFGAGFGLGWVMSFITHQLHIGATNIVATVMTILAVLSQSFFVIYLPWRVLRSKRKNITRPI